MVHKHIVAIWYFIVKLYIYLYTLCMSSLSLSLHQDGDPSDDILPTAGSLQFITNNRQQTITLTILPDDLPEVDEVYSFNCGCDCVMHHIALIKMLVTIILIILLYHILLLIINLVSSSILSKIMLCVLQ